MQGDQVALLIGGGWMHRNVPGLTIVFLALVAATAWADAPDLYGIHYWGYSGSLPADPSPGQLLDVSHQGGWDVEVANTTSNTDVWWTPAWFQPFYQQLYNQHVSIITRLNYNWGETLPRPTLAGG